jgi:tetratricopeptide (TPR) repeat protein
LLEITPWKMEGGENDLILFQDYELLDSAQINCFCGTVRRSSGFNTICPKEEDYPDTDLSNDDRTRWEIYKKRLGAGNTARFSTRAELLDEALLLAKNLQRISPDKGQSWTEAVVHALAKTHYGWGKFERANPEAAAHFEKAAQLLGDVGTFKTFADTSRLSLLAATHLAWGQHAFSTGKYAEAVQHFNLGLVAAGPLFEASASSDSTLLRLYNDYLLGPLYQNLGTALLMEGKSSEAQQAYESASSVFSPYYFPAFLFANVLAFEGDETGAIEEYIGNVYQPWHTAAVFFSLDQLASQFPDKRLRLDKLASNLRTSVFASNQSLLTAEADFWFANYKTEHYVASAQWDSAAVWCEHRMNSAKRCAELPRADPEWTTYWLNEYTNLPYFLLMAGKGSPETLQECIKIVETGEELVAEKESKGFVYQYKAMLKINLGHALILRNQPGDREKGIQLYRSFADSHLDPRGFDNWEMLEKDFRDMRRAGAPFPELSLGERGTMNDER